MEKSKSKSRSATLFVGDIPSDLTEKRFTDVFGRCPGFVSARLRTDRNENMVGFVDFDELSSAAKAIDHFRGFKFNKYDDTPITVQFAHNATRNKDQQVYRSSNRSTSSSNNNNNNNSSYRSRSTSSSSSSKPKRFKTNSENGSYSEVSYYSPFHHPPPFAYNNNSPLATYPSLLPEACSTLYVEGLPLDATEREVAHIFRPWAGFQSLRIFTKPSKKNPNHMYNLCFVEFDNKYQSTIAMHALQGYKMEKNDKVGLNISYAKSKRNSTGSGGGTGSGANSSGSGSDKKKERKKDSKKKASGSGSGSNGDEDHDGSAAEEEEVEVEEGNGEEEEEVEEKEVVRDEGKKERKNSEPSSQT